MTFLNTIHKRKAAVKTALVMALLLLSFFFLGMKYMVPPVELGIEVNFGTSDDGFGDIQPMTTETPTVTESQVQSSESSKEEQILTQDTDDAPAVNTKPITKPTNQNTTTKNTTKKPTQTPDKSTTDALNNILGAPSNTNQKSSGEGDGSGKGDKGQIDGNPYATAYYGGGYGSGTGYGLNGRNKTSSQKYTQDCNEEGKVVVQIEVDRNGRVVKAIPGVQGSTNTDPCLKEPAKRTAESYRFNADPNAPERQIGFVVINFTLGQ